MLAERLRRAIPWAVAGTFLCQLPAAVPAQVPTGARDSDDVSAGYVDDAVCGTCHATLAASYREVGMSRAFGDALAAEQIETYSTPDDPEAGRFFHESSGRWYEMRRNSPDSRPVFRRWLEDEDGREMNVFEAEVDWILGSGHTSRSYLLHQPGGELYVLPVAWYSQEGLFAMAPGFDFPGHGGLQRRVQRECMFCHNAYPPEVERQPDRYDDPHLFPKDLPHGTGCQRCHGPGAAHVEAAYVGGLGDEVRSEIVNPARLTPKLRDDVCEQCHLQPSVALMPTRRFGRGAYSYRPGTDLDEYIVYFDPQELRFERADRFEINHHPYRMRQSACFLGSGLADPAERLSCLSCHDPHRKVPKAQRAEHYRRACQSCHGVDECDLASMTASEQTLPLHMRGVEPGDCAGCHMPRRRTRDVVHVVMTDHKIEKLPGGAEPEASLVAPREEFTPTLVDMDFYLPEAAPAGAVGEVYKAYGVERVGGNESSRAHLERMLPASLTTAEEPWMQLARIYLRQQLPEQTEAVLRKVLAADPKSVRALKFLGLSMAARDAAAGAAYLEAAREHSPFEDPDLHYNLGVVYGGAGRLEKALASLRRAVELRPLHASGWLQLALLQERLGDPGAALDAARRSLAVEPRSGRARSLAARLLVAAGQHDEAVGELRLGLWWSDDPDSMRQALAELGATGGGIESRHGPADGSAERPASGSDSGSGSDR